MVKIFCTALCAALFFSSCKKEEAVPVNYSLIFVYKFDSTQERLGSDGLPKSIPAGNAGQHPMFNEMSAHYIELTPSATTPLGQGAIIYKAEETTAGGASAIDFYKSFRAGNGAAFFVKAIKDIAPGSYEWLRVSLAYQNYNVKFHVDTTISGVSINQEGTGTIASLIGFNTYVTSLSFGSSNLAINGNRKQGFWAFESTIAFNGTNITNVDSGQAAGTTVVNPIAATSPIPAGSCVVTGKINPGKLTITGKETQDIIVEVSLSTNKSFEWQDTNPNGLWEPLKGEKVVDMGIRGMVPRIK